MRDLCKMFTFVIRATSVTGFPLAVTITGVRTSAFQGIGQDVNPRNPVYLSCKFTSPHRINAFRFGCLVKVVGICIKIFPLDSYRPQNLNYPRVTQEQVRLIHVPTQYTCNADLRCDFSCGKIHQ